LKRQNDIRVLFLALLSSGIIFTACFRDEAPQPGAVALVGVRVINLNDGVSGEPSDVLIRDGHIERISATDPDSIPTAYSRFEAEGTYAIPGLWDMHTHIRNDEELETFVPLLVAHGVIGLRDLWGFFPEEFDERLANVPHAPYTYAAARQMMGNNSATANDARARVQMLAEIGVDFIKVQSDVPADSFYAIIDEAQSLGLDVAGHTPIGVSVSNASSAGLETQEHLVEVLVETSDRANSIRADRVHRLTSSELSMGEYILELGYPDLEPMLSTWNEERENELFSTLVENHTWQVPTLALFRAWSRVHLSEFWDNDALRYVPASWRDTWTPTGHKWYSKFQANDPETVRSRIRGTYQALLQILGRMHAAGVPIMAGTDASQWNFIVPGQSLHDELAIYVEAGMTPLEALRTATVAPIEFLGLEDQAGSVDIGKRADMVLLDENPVEDIGNLGSIRAMMIRGRIFDRDYLEALLNDLERRSNPDVQLGRSSATALAE
jgi:imidazolonepropionase-like amidohydrolase